MSENNHPYGNIEGIVTLTHDRLVVRHHTPVPLQNESTPRGVDAECGAEKKEGDR